MSKEIEFIKEIDRIVTYWGKRVLKISNEVNATRRVQGMAIEECHNDIVEILIKYGYDKINDPL